MKWICGGEFLCWVQFNKFNLIYMVGVVEKSRSVSDGFALTGSLHLYTTLLSSKFLTPRFLLFMCLILPPASRYIVWNIQFVHGTLVLYCLYFNFCFMKLLLKRCYINRLFRSIFLLKLKLIHASYKICCFESVFTTSERNSHVSYTIRSTSYNSIFIIICNIIQLLAFAEEWFR